MNTSAFLEAAIVGRPVYSLLLPEFYEHQEGTLHFRYLLDVEGGVLHAARSIAAHLAQLSALLREPDTARAKSDHFVRTFIRPRGLDMPASEVFVQELEERKARSLIRPERLPYLSPALRRLFGWVVRHRDEPRVRAWLLSEKEAGVYEKRRTKDRAWRDNKDNKREAKRREKSERRLEGERS